MTRRAWVVVVAVGLAACSATPPEAQTSSGNGVGRQLKAEVASYDIALNSPQAFLIGLIGPDQESVAYGSIDVSFAYTGTADEPLAAPRIGHTVTAQFVPLAGTNPDPAAPGPQLVEPATALGVYRADAITFDAVGYWQADVHVKVAGHEATTSASFEVLVAHQVPFVGDRAPRTRQPLIGDSTVLPVALDSRAQGQGVVPDPSLHATAIADALDDRRPLMVVIATPTYCTSRFCGPITDAVERVAARYGDRMAFAHLEIWADYANNQLNPSVQAWIVPRDGSEGREPWVFVVDRDGRIAKRFDNVAGDAELDAAAQAVLQ